MWFSFHFSLLLIPLSLFLAACKFFDTSIPEDESIWIHPLDEKIDLEDLRFNNSEVLSIIKNPEGLTSLYTEENKNRGDERNAWQNKLYYNSLGFTDFLGEATTTYYEVPFRNSFSLSLKIGAILWDANRRRSREFLPIGSPKARLIFVKDLISLKQKEDKKTNKKTTKANLEFPMVWDNRKDAFNYEALLTPKEFNELLMNFENNPEGKLFLNIQNRNYDVTKLKNYLITDRNQIRENIDARNSVTLFNLQKLSRVISGKQKFSSPWMKLGKFFAKVQAIYTTNSNSSIRLELILGSYNPAPLRAVFLGKDSLIFHTEDQIFFLPFEKLSFFNTLQQKQSSFLSFSTIPSDHKEFFQNTTWKDKMKEFWQINLSSQEVSAEDLKTIQAILSDPTHTISLSLTEDLMFTNGPVIDFIQHLLKLLYPYILEMQNPNQN